MTATKRLPAVERRAAVLEEACLVFSRMSYRGATTAEIARAAGISEPILYRHFGSKRDLYLACLEETWQQFRRDAEEAIAGDPESCLGRIADRYMASRERIRLVDLWIQALSVAPEDAVIAKALREQIRQVHDFFADVIRQGQAAGHVLPERDAVAEAWIFIGAGMLTTVDGRLGGLLGDDLQRVRTERRRFMTGK
jgi:AcrR family transcriptional regulator